MSEPAPRRVTLRGNGGLPLAADEAGPEGAMPVVLLHGGGQTRGSWRNGFMAIARAGYHVVAIDARGHGESGWAPDGDYRLAAQVADLKAILGQLPARPVLVGASMGGTVALGLLGEADAPPVRALALVDVSPRVSREGVDRIAAFMRSGLDGFATIEEASEAVSAYNPSRARRPGGEGLRRNLREINGRLFWHWDPAFLGTLGMNGSVDQARMDTISRALTLPVLLVRGGRSDVVRETDAAAFRALVPTARYVDVAGASHMVVGDRNDAFNAAILAFLADLEKS